MFHAARAAPSWSAKGAPDHCQAQKRPSDDSVRPDCQTLMRALDVVFAVAETGGLSLGQLQARVGLTKSTTYRLAAALLRRRLLARSEQLYILGPGWVALADEPPDSAL